MNRYGFAVVVLLCLGVFFACLTELGLARFEHGTMLSVVLAFPAVAYWYFTRPCLVG